MNRINLISATIASLLSLIAPWSGIITYDALSFFNKGISAVYWKFNIEPYGFGFNGDTETAVAWIVMIAFYLIAALLIWKLYKQYKSGAISSRYVVYPSVALGLSLALFLLLLVQK